MYEQKGQATSKNQATLKGYLSTAPVIPQWWGK